MRLHRLLLIVLLLPGLALAQQPCTVSTVSGPVTGLVQDGIRTFKGLPYAQPPVGDLRWKPPQPAQPWTGPRPATEFGPACPQLKDRIVQTPQKQSEDCLYLNVYSPAEAYGLPVMVWIHGGGFTNGTGSLPLYEGSALARHGVVLVTINYRLGLFGFFAHPALTAESSDGVCGNYGLMDQIAALKWVRDNAERFGGDPGNVTIFGESAGAVSVSVLMTSPPAQGLFHRAIIQSGGAPKRVVSRQEAEQRGLQTQRRLGVADGPQALAALRALPADKLLTPGAGDDALPGLSMRSLMCVDGQVLKEPPAEVFAAGRQARVPLMTGSTADEGTLWSRRLPVSTVEKYRGTLRVLFQDRAAEVERLYPAATDADVQQAVEALMGDGFVATVRRNARSMLPLSTPVYLYQFVRQGPVARRTGLGAFHASELPYVFGTMPERMPFAPDERQLSEAMMGYWTRFARTGDPNGDGTQEWPGYTLADDNHLVLDWPISAGQHLRQAQCDLWDSM